MEHLKDLRKAAKKKQWEMADLIGVERTTWAKWETGVNAPGLEMVQRIADYFGVSTDYLLGREEADSEDREMWELREELRSNPDLRMLFSMTHSSVRAQRAGQHGARQSVLRPIHCPRTALHKFEPHGTG